MKTTRKNFLATVAGSLAAAVLRPGDLLAAPPDAFEPHHFRGLVGEPFVFDPGDRSGPVYMVLAAYSDRAPSNGTHQFTLTFQAPAGDRLKEGTYSVAQDRMGSLRVFIVPTGTDSAGRTLFRADFNLLTPK